MPWISVAEQKFKRQNFCLSSFPNAVSKCMCHFFNLCSWKTGRFGCWNRPRTINIHQRGVRVARSADIAKTRSVLLCSRRYGPLCARQLPLDASRCLRLAALWSSFTTGTWPRGRALNSTNWAAKKHSYNSTRRADRPKYFLFFHNNKSFSISRWDVNLFTEFATVNLCLGGKIFGGGGVASYLVTKIKK